MGITYDPKKRARTFATRGLDFEDAAFVFEGVTVEVKDTRKDYGETRIISSDSWKVALSSWAIRNAARISTYSA